MLRVENRPLVMTCSTAESPGIIAAKRPWRSGEYARDKERDAGAGATRRAHGARGGQQAELHTASSYSNFSYRYSSRYSAIDS